MSSYVLLHNPRCRNSREAKAILEEKNITFKTRIYLQDTLSKQELQQLMKLTRLSIRDIVRKNEQIYKSLQLENKTDNELVDAMIENPILLERPIFMTSEKAVICRPAEKVFELIS